MTSWRPALALVCIATFLPELASGSTPLSAYMSNPGTTPLLALAYGLPVLAIREFAARRNVGAFGLLIMGLAYGVLNEGLIAKTNTLPTDLPMPAYTGYGQLLGLNLPWAAALMLWHAVCSVLFPILATEHLFAQQVRKPWLSTWPALLAATVAMGFGILAFLGDFRGYGSPALLMAYLSLMLALVLVANGAGRQRAKTRAPPSIGSLLLGLTTSVLYVALSAIAENKLPLLLFFAVLLAGSMAYIWGMSRKGWTNSINLLLFGIGCYIPTALLSLVPAFRLTRLPLDRLFTGCIVAAIMLASATVILWRARGIQSSSKA